MNTTKETSKNKNGARVVLGIAALLLVGSILSGLNLGLGISDRAVLIILVVFGMAMCAGGMKLERYGWQNPFNMLGSVIGAAALLLIACVFLGLRIPLITSDRAAILALGVLMLLKVLVAAIRARVAKPLLHPAPTH
jgi:hypothetical protein